MKENYDFDWVAEEDCALYRKLRIYDEACALSDEIWNIVQDWPAFAKDTVGGQWVRSADSVAANLSEGSGRGSTPELLRFACIARGSLCETQHWTQRAVKRTLIKPKTAASLKTQLNTLLKQLNAFITYHKNKL